MLIHCTGLEFPLGLGSIFTLIHCRLHACLNILEIPGLNFKMLNTYMFLLNRTTWPLGWNQWWVLSMFRVFNSLHTPHTSSISIYCFILSFYTIRNAYMSLNIIIRLVCCSWFAYRRTQEFSWGLDFLFPWGEGGWGRGNPTWLCRAGFKIWHTKIIQIFLKHDC